jgi:hypothetical protein
MSKNSPYYILGYAMGAMESVQRALIQNENSDALSKINESIITIKKMAEEMHETTIDKRSDA